MPAFNRRYAVRKVIARGQGIFCLVFGAIWALLLSEGAGLVFLLVGAVATLFAVWQAVIQVSNGGVRETAEEIINRRTFGYDRWRWDEIERFFYVGSRV